MSQRTYKIAVTAGDGIGPDIVGAAIQVLTKLGPRHNVAFAFTHALIGGVAIDATGGPFPEETLKICKESDAVLLGAVGGPKWEPLDYSIRPERGLLAIRKELGAFANLRPVKLFKPLVNASTLKPEVVADIDMIVVRELTGDVYFGTPRGVTKDATGMETGVNTMIYTTPEIVRVAKVAFELSRKRRKKVTSIDKANVLESTELWRNVVMAVHKDYPDVALNHMYVDNCAMQLVRNPKQFDVILTGNLFGDILSDEASMLTGSIGMLASASIGGKIGIFEPIHGSAPDIAGKDLANPIATILSAGMMCELGFGIPAIAREIEAVIEKVLNEGYRTPDIYSEGCTKVGTKEMTKLILDRI